MPEENRPELKITVFSDYICPFCYLGHHRLMRLQDEYDLKINWCFLEIHPETSARGEDIEALDYSSSQWQQMLDKLHNIAREENVPLSRLTFITNSRDALLLAEAAKECGREQFYDLHEKLFQAYFVDGKNIGDRSILRRIAADCDMDEDGIENAWQEDRFRQRLTGNYHSARQYRVQSVPSFVFGKQVLTGVVSEDAFRQAAKQSASL